MRAKYVPPKRKLTGPKTVLTEKQYWSRIGNKQPVPQGTVLRVKAAKATNLSKLKVRFLATGEIEIPYYAGKEGNLRIIKFLRTKTVPEGVRLVYHQIESVKSRARQATQIFDTVSKLHYDLHYNWNKFNSAQKTAFTAYLKGAVGELTKNPLLLRDENKIHAAERFGRAAELLEQGNSTAAEAVLRGIKNNMGNWKRKLVLQEKRLKRRRDLVRDKKFERDARIFSAVDSMMMIINQLRGRLTPEMRKKIAGIIRGTVKKLYATGWNQFKQAAIIVDRAAELVERGEIGKARRYIRDANKKTILAASGISSIYPDKLREIRNSTDNAFKERVLTNQTLLFHDMMELWWAPKKTSKTKLILDSVQELTSLAGNLKKIKASEFINAARTALEKNNITAFVENMELAAITLNPKLAQMLAG